MQYSFDVSGGSISANWKQINFGFQFILYILSELFEIHWSFTTITVFYRTQRVFFLNFKDKYVLLIKFSAAQFSDTES